MFSWVDHPHTPSEPATKGYVEEAAGNPFIGFTKLCTITSNTKTDLHKVIKTEDIVEIMFHFKNATITGSGSYINISLDGAGSIFPSSSFYGSTNITCVLKFIACGLKTYRDSGQSPELIFQNNNNNSTETSIVYLGQEWKSVTFPYWVSGSIDVYAKFVNG